MRNYRKSFVISMIIVFTMISIILFWMGSGKSFDTLVSKIELPQGYSIFTMSDGEIVFEDDDMNVVGGMKKTSLKPKQIANSADGFELDEYINSIAWGCEYIAMSEGSIFSKKCVLNLSVTEEDGARKAYFHILFSEGVAVYDLWCNSEYFIDDIVQEIYKTIKI